MTNGDYFRNMTDHEIAQYMNGCGFCSKQDEMGCDGKCRQHIEEWLGQEKDGEQE